MHATACSASPTPTGAPWYVANTDDKKRGRRTVIRHVPDQVRYTPLDRSDVELPKRKATGHEGPDLPLRRIPTLS